MPSTTPDVPGTNANINPPMSQNNLSLQVEQHSLAKSVFLHLFPGVLITVFYLIAVPIFIKLGFPPVFALCLAIPVVLIPSELGFLLYLGKKRNGKFSLENIVLYRASLGRWQYIFFVLIIILLSALSFLILSKPTGSFIAERFFSWAPEWYTGGNSFEGTAPILLTTWIMIMIFANILGPAVEELYFRGYLLPRISRFGAWAPVLNAALFAIYHFWTPWDVVTRIAAVLPVSYIAFFKKNIYIGMIAHIMLNTLSTISLLGLIFK